MPSYFLICWVYIRFEPLLSFSLIYMYLDIITSYIVAKWHCIFWEYLCYKELKLLYLTLFQLKYFCLQKHLNKILFLYCRWQMSNYSVLKSEKQIKWHKNTILLSILKAFHVAVLPKNIIALSIFIIKHSTLTIHKKPCHLLIKA